MVSPNKRQRVNSTNSSADHNTSTVTKNIETYSIFENLPNEVICEIFELIDISDLYQAFFDLNQRFRNLLTDSSFSVRVDLCSISKPTFTQHYTQYIRPNAYRVKLFYSSNPVGIDWVDLSVFPRLQTLILKNANAQQIENLLQRLLPLPNLSSLSIATLDYPRNKAKFYQLLFQLSVLKCLTVSFHDDWEAQPVPSAAREHSSLEYLRIKSSCQWHELAAYLSYTPQLRHLTCDDLHGICEPDAEMLPLPLNHVRHLSLRLHEIPFERLEMMIMDTFHQLEVLRLVTSEDNTYLDASRWERLIAVHMTSLRIFDFQHTNFAFDNQFPESTCETLISQFATPFWLQRNWIFGHEHNWAGYSNNAIFYSIHSDRSRFCSLSANNDRDRCPYLDDTSLTAIRHVRLVDERVLKHPTSISFPNATQLIVSQSLLVENDLFKSTLDRLLSFTSLRKIVVHATRLYFNQLLAMLYLTPNCRTLMLDAISLPSTLDWTFQPVLDGNHMRSLTIRNKCSSRQVKFFITLFPQLEHFAMRTSYQSARPVMEFLLARKRTGDLRLFSLNFLKITMEMVREITTLLDTDQLSVDYTVKVIGDNCYLWW